MNPNTLVSKEPAVRVAFSGSGVSSNAAVTAVTFTPREVCSYYATRLPQLKQRGREWRSPCPIHGGKKDSFAVQAETGRWFCHSTCGRGGDILALEMALKGSDFEAATAAVFDIAGRPRSKQSSKPRIVAEYSYKDEGGRVLYQVVRLEPKSFRQRRPGGGGGWHWNIKGVRLVLYGLPELLKRGKEIVYICEGERDCHTLESFGLLATCNPMGAGKWRPEYSEVLRGRAVVLLPDNDPPGRKHAAAVAADLLRIGCGVRIVGVPKGKDVSDWFAAGGTPEDLQHLVSVQPALTAGALKTWCTRCGLANEEREHQAARPEPGSLTTRCLSDIEAKPVCWLWPGRIARGKLTILAGDPGLGKSQIAASIAAIVTAGGCWPVDRQRCAPADVLFLSAEDDPADTLRPRLEAAGADLRRTYFVDGVVSGYAGDGTQRDRNFCIAEDLQALETKLRELRDVGAVVIDPITAYLGETDSHKNAEVRGLLMPLSELAARHNMAVIGVSHLTKAVGTQALMRVTGSLAFVAAARAAYLVAPDPEDKARRLFLPLKNNLGPDVSGLAYSIEAAIVDSSAGSIETSRVVWHPDPVLVTADDLTQSDTPKGTSALHEAMDWLQGVLADRALAAAEVLELARADGISEKTLRRAQKALGIQSVKIAMAQGWSWSLPKTANIPEDGRTRKLGTFGHNGHLQPSDTIKGKAALIALPS